MAKYIDHRHEFIFKAIWPSTMLMMKVLAPDYGTAIARAERQVLKMDGGHDCCEVKFIRQSR